MRTVILCLVYSAMFLATSAQSFHEKEIGKQIDSLVALQLKDGTPGGVVGVILKGEIVYQQNYGLMNLEQKMPVDEQTLFDIASVAKQFTAFAVLLLENEGKLQLDEDIRTYLPDLPDFGYNITVRHLLQHTSGIASTDVLRLFAGISLAETWTQQDEIALIASYPMLNFEPNTQFTYSNAGYSLLARIVETVSGMDFASFLKTNIFDPLQMNSAFVNDRAGKAVEHMAIGYKVEEEEFAPCSSTEDYNYGSGNIFLSLQDMIKWGKNFFSPTIGNERLILNVFDRYNTLANGDSIDYTYGFFVREHKGIKMVEHSGGVPGFRNQLMIFPDEDLLIIAMFNNEDIATRRLSLGIAELILAGKLVEETPKPRVAIDIDHENLHAFEGTFQMPDGMELTFSLEQDTFWLKLPGAPNFQLFAESNTKFFLKAFDAQCTFTVASDGTVNEMIWHQGGGDYVAVRVGERKPLQPHELADFAGLYIQEDLKADYRITYQDEQLSLQVPHTFKTYLGFDQAILSHINGDKFLTDKLGMLQFTRDGQGQLNGFILLDVGRLQNIKFVKQR
jgi:CubicO group peptidase (beta-lactamase class C family)